MDRNIIVILILSLFFSSCTMESKKGVDKDTLMSLGSRHKNDFFQLAEDLKAEAQADSKNSEALLAYAETEIILYIFGFMPRTETLPLAKEAFFKASKIDSVSSKYYEVSGMINMLDWKWEETEVDFLKSIEIDPRNLNVRHWYSLYLSAMGEFEKAMVQSDIIATMDENRDYLLGRGSLLYFARKNIEMRDLMIEVVKMDTSVAWAYDWLGMAYCELEDYDNSLETYFKAFELADGTVEVGAGLGHALGMAGQYKVAKEMADYYEIAAKTQYLPSVQRSFIHIGIGEYEKAIDLLEQAYDEHSWFLIFVQIEPWYDPIRGNERFDNLVKQMNFPN